jgi:hypothetical protein
VADDRGEAQVITPGPHWVKIAARSAILIRPIGRMFEGLIPAFQTDPSVPRGSVRVVYGPRTVELQNSLPRPVSVGLAFVKADTLNNLTLLARSTKELKDS